MSSTAGRSQGEPPITATVVTYEDQEDECTLHPANPDEHERTTAWISAKSDSYVPLSSCR
ncbi:hypothetical protein [Halobacterium sp. R2-5]|uniref:DUF7511 domain-containing protein n=1 Tax=Halobacterium sp. R2-5 TaxID=2715751 RepID=UPI0014200135|nr:hypothetical protein [Halobacterium sp. R2-5]NIB99558.1 hypothetical protein [Halobacterium sp. R2-5]